MYGAPDGLFGEGVKRQRAVVNDAEGRVWLSTTSGVAMADPVRTAEGEPAVLAAIEKVAADGVDLALTDLVRVPPRRQQVTIAFAGLSLAVPERVLVRYRLDGLDQAWSAPTQVRQVVYSNLKPGQYTFRVVASRHVDDWRGPEAAIRLGILPAYWQTAWFRSAMVAAAGLAAWLFVRLRMRQVARQLTLRFDERIAERTRIAQELHDTLLQGFISASMQLHVAASTLPAGSASRSAIDRVLGIMTRVIDEGRNAVRGLRSPLDATLDLVEELSRVPEDAASPGRPDYRAIVEGHSRPLAAAAREDVHRILREALLNAFRHADARHVELEVHYGAESLRAFVRDDGIGIDPGVLSGGREGHFGLGGMRERAQAIGGRLTVWSKPMAGTEVELVVPARVAFAGPAPRGWRAWRRRPAADGGNPRGEGLVTTVTPIRVFGVDDHPLLREGIAAIVGNEGDMRMVAQASTGREAIDRYREIRPDVTLMDLRLPDLNGIDVLVAIRREFPDARVLILTTFEGDAEITRALAAGARGYVLKTTAPGELVAAIRQVHAGRKRIPPEVAAQLAEHVGDEVLTERELDVLREVATGRRNRGDRRAPRDLGRDRQGAREAHPREARRQRSHRGGDARRPPRHHSSLNPTSNFIQPPTRPTSVPRMRHRGSPPAGDVPQRHQRYRGRRTALRCEGAAQGAMPCSGCSRHSLTVVRGSACSSCGDGRSARRREDHSRGATDSRARRGRPPGRRDGRPRRALVRRRRVHSGRQHAGRGGDGARLGRGGPHGSVACTVGGDRRDVDLLAAPRSGRLLDRRPPVRPPGDRDPLRPGRDALVPAMSPGGEVSRGA